jgi:hypothetical protein
MDGGTVPAPPPDLPEATAGLDQKELLFAVAGYLFDGRYGWQTRLAERIRKEPRTVRRWLSGQDAIDPTAWELIRLLVAWKARNGEVA